VSQWWSSESGCDALSSRNSPPALHLQRPEDYPLVFSLSQKHETSKEVLINGNPHFNTKLKNVALEGNA
jgi:hypothetical protein